MNRKQRVSKFLLEEMTATVEYQIILLPQANYYGWVEAAKDYVLKFGANLTPDPDSAGRYMIPQQTITIAGAPNGYPAQGDIRAWFRKNYPRLRIDYVPAATPAAFKQALAARIAADARYGAPAQPPQTSQPPPAPPPVQYPWPPGVCLVGVHGRTDGRLQPADFDVIARSRAEAVKLMSTAAPEDVDRLRAMDPRPFLLVRLFISMTGRSVSGAQFAHDITYEMGQFYQRGVRYFEIHNEPNLVGEGWTTAWQNGREFGQWFLEARQRLKAQFPEALFGYPGLSPDGFPVPERTNDLKFREDSDEAVRLADWIGAHCYWVDEAGMNSPSGGMGWQEIRRRYPDKLIFITEFSNPLESVDRRTKGQQYVKYYQALRNIPGLGAAFSFVLSAPYGFPNEVWRDENGQPSEIPLAVGARTDVYSGMRV
jgi:hypothetical protein